MPRSRTRGFFYDAKANSIAFKSDPVDGECGGGLCSPDGIIEDTEVAFAVDAVTRVASRALDVASCLCGACRESSESDAARHRAP